MSSSVWEMPFHGCHLSLASVLPPVWFAFLLSSRDFGVHQPGGGAGQYPWGGFGTLPRHERERRAVWVGKFQISGGYEIHSNPGCGASSLSPAVPITGLQSPCGATSLHRVRAPVADTKQGHREGDALPRWWPAQGAAPGVLWGVTGLSLLETGQEWSAKGTGGKISIKTGGVWTFSWVTSHLLPTCSGSAGLTGVLQFSHGSWKCGVLFLL